MLQFYTDFETIKTKRLGPGCEYNCRANISTAHFKLSVQMYAANKNNHKFANFNACWTDAPRMTEDKSNDCLWFCLIIIYCCDLVCWLKFLAQWKYTVKWRKTQVREQFCLFNWRGDMRKQPQECHLTRNFNTCNLQYPAQIMSWCLSRCFDVELLAQSN